MTDDEINRRVAEIEGWIESDTPDDPYWVNGMTGDIYDGAPMPNNPAPPFATDWALIGPIMERFWHSGDFHLDEISKHHREFDLKHAICLAVIAAEEE